MTDKEVPLVHVIQSFQSEINPKFRVGVSGYYIFRSMVDTEEASISENFANDASLRRFALTSSEVTVSSGSLLFGVGLHWEPIKNLRLGLFASTPSTAVHSDGAIRTVRSGANVGCPSETPCADSELVLKPFFQERDVSNLGSGFGIAPMLRLGFAYEKPKWFLIAADVVHYRDIEYALLRDSENAQRIKLALKAALEEGCARPVSVRRLLAKVK